MAIAIRGNKGPKDGVLNSAGALTLVKLNSGARSKTGLLNLETRSKGTISQYHGELSSPARLPMVTRRSSSCVFQLGQPGYFTAKAPPAFDSMENPRHGWSSRYSRGRSGDAAAKAPRVVSRGLDPAQEGISDDNGPHRNSSSPPSSSRVWDKGPGLEDDARSYNLPHRPAIGHR